jgi:DNA-binding Lrp family transcriptional regulator
LELEACALIKTIPTKTVQVARSVKKMKSVRKAYVSYGRFDIIAFIKVSSYDAVRKLTKDVNTIDGVRSTETLVKA